MFERAMTGQAHSLLRVKRFCMGKISLVLAVFTLERILTRGLNGDVQGSLCRVGYL